jgi:hypothetical protein
MQRIVLAAVIVLTLLCSPWLAAQSAAKQLTNQDIKDLVAVGLSSDVIIDKIHAAGATNFDTSVEALKSLKAANVPDAVIRVMINPHAVPPVSSAAPAASSPGTQHMEPELTEAVYFLDSAAQTLKPLPKATPKPASKADSSHGSTTVKAAIQIPGSASSFHVKGGNDLEFVVKCENPYKYLLLPFTKQGDNREGIITLVKVGAFGAGKEKKSFIIPVGVSAYGESTYRLVVKAPDAGEYGFTVDNDVYDFAVDPK